MKEEKFKLVLSKLNTITSIEGSCIVSRDGLIIYSNMKDVRIEAFAAMLATLLSSAEVAFDEIKSGVPNMVLIDGKTNKIIIAGAGTTALIASVASSASRTVYNAVKLAGKKLDKILSEKND